MKTKQIDFWLIVFLILAVLKINLRLSSTLDIDGTDETEYLGIALGIPAAGLPDARTETFFAPLYSLWYFFLSHFKKDPVGLIDLNFRIMAVLLPVGLYGVLRRLGAGWIASGCAAFYLACHSLSIDQLSRSNHFAMILLVGGMWLALKCTDRIVQTCVLAGAAVLASFARPEFAVLAASLVAILFVLCVGRRGRLEKAEWLSIAAVASLAALTLGIFGPPMGAGNNRSLTAFNQHFAFNYLAKHPSDLEPFIDSTSITESVFGPITSISGAFRKNPREFLGHITTNATGALRRLVPTLLHHRNFLLPDGARTALAENGLLVALILAVAWIERRNLIANIRDLLKEHAIIVTFCVVTVGVSWAGILLTSVNERYFLPSCLVALIFAAVVFGRDRRKADQIATTVRPVYAILALGLAIVGLAPGVSLHEQNYLSIRTALREVAGLRLKEKAGYVDILGTGSKRMDLYFGGRLFFVHPAANTRGLRDFITQFQVGVIHSTPYLMRWGKFANDPEWKQFVADPGSFGFQAKALPFNDVLYVKNAILETP